MQFSLRPWELEDAPYLAAYANNEQISNNLMDSFPYPYALSDAEQFIQKCQRHDPDSICYAIEVEGKAVGSIGVFKQQDVHKKSATIGYWLAQPYWNQGIMSRAIKQITDEAFKKLDILRISAEVFGFNKASIRALQKAGYVQEAVHKRSIYKNGQIYDGYLMVQFR